MKSGALRHSRHISGASNGTTPTMDFKGILSSLPPVDFGFAYGSGVLEQHGYDNRATNPPMIDLVVATSNSTRWHEDNLVRNASHYSGIRVLGAGALAAFQDNYGAGIFYNPLVSHALTTRL